MRGIWTLARLDLAVWRRSPWAIAAAIIPPLGMYVLVHVLSLAVTQQPVALVVDGTGPQTDIVTQFLVDDDESYLLQITSAGESEKLLAAEKVAAIITIPESFDADVAAGSAKLTYVLNNTDIDFADDIRRSIDRSIALFDAPQLGSSVEGAAGEPSFVVPNPYRVDLSETKLRDTDVEFETYQVLPVLLLLILSLGILGGSLLGSRDHERRTSVYLASAPIRRGELVAGRLIGTIIATLTVLVPVVAWMTWRGTIDPVEGHWGILLAILALTTVFASGLGVLLGVLFRRTSTVALASIIVASYLFFLGGGFTTVAFLPEWLRVLSRTVPTRYAIDGMRTALFYPVTTDIGFNIGMLAAFSAGVVLLAVVVLGRQKPVAR